MMPQPIRTGWALSAATTCSAVLNTIVTAIKGKQFFIMWAPGVFSRMLVFGSYFEVGIGKVPQPEGSGSIPAGRAF
jgi:hypothetical protein